jgi:hypothetical protein
MVLLIKMDNRLTESTLAETFFTVHHAWNVPAYK